MLCRILNNSLKLVIGGRRIYFKPKLMLVSAPAGCDKTRPLTQAVDVGFHKKRSTQLTLTGCLVDHIHHGIQPYSL